MKVGVGIKEYKDEIIEKFQNGASVSDLATEYEVTDETMRVRLQAWGLIEKQRELYPEYDIDSLEKAPQQVHKCEKVTDKETGKTYYDITDYIVDCGTGGNR